MFGEYRAAEAAVLDESALRCVQPAARYFFLGEKVPKTPHKGIPLMNPLKQNDSYPFCFRHYLIGMANRLPRSPAPAVIFSVRAFVLKCLIQKQVPEDCCNRKAHRRKGRKLPFITEQRASGANAVRFRAGVPIIERE